MRVVGSDPVSLTDVLELLDKQIAEQAWSYGMVHDARRVSWLPTEADVASVVAFVDLKARRLGPRGPVAFVAFVAASAALFGMPRMYSQIATGSALRGEVFPDLVSAERWLDGEMAHR